MNTNIFRQVPVNNALQPLGKTIENPNNNMHSTAIAATAPPNAPHLSPAKRYKIHSLKVLSLK